MIYTTHTPSRYSKCTLYYTNWKVVHKMCVKTEDWRQRLKFVHNQKLISSAFTVIYPSISAICSLNCTFLNFFWTMKNVMRLPKRIEFFFQAKVEIFLYDGVIKISFGWANLHDGDSFMWVILKSIFQWILWLFFVVCIAFELLLYFSPCLYVELKKGFLKSTYYNSKG